MRMQAALELGVVTVLLRVGDLEGKQDEMILEGDL